MVIRKICMVGDPGVGKTRLVEAWRGNDATGAASPAAGVSVHRKVVRTRGSEVSLVVLDLSGRLTRSAYPPDFLRGCAGYVLVLDTSGPVSLEQAQWLRARVEAGIGPAPSVVAANKADLGFDPGVGWSDLAALAGGEEWLLPTSAVTGEGVDALFERLAQRLLQPAPPLARRA